MSKVNDKVKDIKVVRKVTDHKVKGTKETVRKATDHKVKDTKETVRKATDHKAKDTKGIVRKATDHKVKIIIMAMVQNHHNLQTQNYSKVMMVV